jgi:anti-anti-sigma factor
VNVTRGPGSAVVGVTGEIDLSSVGALNACLRKCIDEGCTDITLDMSGITFMDSSGIASLLKTKQHLDEASGNLTLSNPSQSVRKLLDLTALSSIFAIIET